MSTGDSRRTKPKKSAPAATGNPDPAEESVPEGPVGGVLPVKKIVRPAAAAGRGGAGTRTGASGTAAKNGGARTGTSSAGANGGRTSGAKAGSTGGRSTVTETIESPARKSTAKTASRTPTKSAAKTAGVFGPAAKGGKGGKGGGKRPVAPVRVAEKKNWSSIALFVGTGLVALLIIGFAAWPAIQRALQPAWEERAAAIEGIVNYIDPASPNYHQPSTQANHVPGDQNYEVNPPVGGNHNDYWQNCMGDVYPAQIADEHAVHSLEHGAVWITYRPDLPQDQVDKLAARVRDVPYLFMSPHPVLVEKPISLQAWGYQLKVDNADDERIDQFIDALRINAALEKGAACSSGINQTSPTPFDLSGGMN